MRKPGIPNGSRTNAAFDFIVAEVERSGVFPSVSDILDHMGWKARTAVRDTLERLANQGRLRRTRTSIGTPAYEVVQLERVNKD